MKLIDMKSLIIGMLITGISIALMSNSPQEKSSTLTISSDKDEVFIYNQESRHLYKYNLNEKGSRTSPDRTYLVSSDGSRLGVK